MSIQNTGQRNSDLNAFFSSADNKDQLLNINEGNDNIKEIYLLSKSTSLSNTIDKFFEKISDSKGIDNRQVKKEPIHFENQDNTITVPEPVGLVVYLTKGQLTELKNDAIIASILNDAGRIEINPTLTNRDDKTIKNLKYETIGQVYSTAKFKTNSFKLDNSNNDILDNL